MDVGRYFSTQSCVRLMVFCGGVLDWRDAAEMILAGATAVGVGTGLFVDPSSPRRINKGLARWVRSQGCSAIHELVGAFEE